MLNDLQGSFHTTLWRKTYIFYIQHTPHCLRHYKSSVPCLRRRPAFSPHCMQSSQIPSHVSFLDDFVCFLSSNQICHFLHSFLLCNWTLFFLMILCLCNVEIGLWLQILSDPKKKLIFWLFVLWIKICVCLCGMLCTKTNLAKINLENINHTSYRSSWSLIYFDSIHLYIYS